MIAVNTYEPDISPVGSICHENRNPNCQPFLDLLLPCRDVLAVCWYNINSYFSRALFNLALRFLLFTSINFFSRDLIRCWLLYHFDFATLAAWFSMFWNCSSTRNLFEGRLKITHQKMVRYGWFWENWWKIMFAKLYS